MVGKTPKFITKARARTAAFTRLNESLMARLTRSRRCEWSICRKKSSRTHLTRSAYSPQWSTTTWYPIRRRSSTTSSSAYGTLAVATFPLSNSLVIEFADDGDLFQKITYHQKDGTYFLERDIWKIFIQVVRGLKALHDIKIMHRDLKV